MLYLVEEDIYIDVFITGWTGGGGGSGTGFGGGFSYRRSTPTTIVSVQNSSEKRKPHVYPSLVKNWLKLDFNQSFTNVKYTILNALGQEVISGTINADEEVDVSELKKGLHLITLDIDPFEKLVFIKL